MTACTRSPTPSLARMRATWVLAVASLMNSRAQISGAALVLAVALFTPWGFLTSRVVLAWVAVAGVVLVLSPDRPPPCRYRAGRAGDHVAGRDRAGGAGAAGRGQP